MQLGRRSAKRCRHTKASSGTRPSPLLHRVVMQLKYCVVPKVLSTLGELASSSLGKGVDECIVQPLGELVDDALEMGHWQLLASVISFWFYVQSVGWERALLTGMATVCLVSLFRRFFRKKRGGENER